MKVVQLLPELNGGGVERGTLEVAKALVDAGHESIVLSAGGQLVEQLETTGSRHIPWDLGRKSLFTLRHVRSLRRWLAEERPDIIHVRSRLPAWIAWLAWRKLPQQQRPRLISTVHGLYSVSGYSSIMCRSERIIAVSETVRDYIRKSYPATDMQSVALIRRGVDPEEFPRDYTPSSAWLDGWYKEYPQLQGKRVLILPGRLSRSKGHDDFLQLLQSLNRLDQNCFGLIVGGTDQKRQHYTDELQKQAAEMGLGDNLIFTGARRDMREIYAVSDLVLSLSNKPESFGRTVLEALSIGTPVVGYDHGGVSEILRELFPEGLVPVKNGTALLASAQNILNLESIAIKENHFLLQDMLYATLNCYDDLLTKS